MKWKATIGFLLIINILLISFFPLHFIFGYTPTISTGESMGNNYGSVSFINNSFDQVEEGDVILFENDCGDMIKHRIIGEVENGYITQGDNNPVPDQIAECYNPVTEEQIEGVEAQLLFEY